MKPSSLRIALVGSPNSGKTTLFNRMTGLRAKTVNYPGSTVDLLIGDWHDHELTDTPGVYSLHPRSPDEAITIEALKRNPPDLVIAVVDATQLSRQLALVRQLSRAKVQVLVALTMVDLLRDEGETVDVARLKLELGVDIVPVIPAEATGFVALTEAVNQVAKKVRPSDSAKTFELVDDQTPEQDLQEARAIASRALKRIGTVNVADGPRARTRKIDRFVLHPVFGPLIFLAIMTALFTSIYWMAQPVMDLVDHGFAWLNATVLAINSQNLFVRFLAEGVIAGAGAVLVFVPQIFILFIGIILLEDSGYLARAATIIDRPLAAIGLGGRSFVPLLSGFACAVPAMLASRSINSKKERWLTLFVLPLMSCSARLPVYALLLGFLFPGEALKAGLALSLLYIGSVLSGVLAAIVMGPILNRAGWFKNESSFFLLELPLYRRPQLLLVLRQAFLRTKTYVNRAGLTILTLSVLIWVGINFPNYKNEDPTERIESSFAGQLGRVVSPVFAPMGGDWRTGLGLISAFAAREVFVSTMAVIFHVTDTDEDSMREGLLKQMREAKTSEGAPLFTFSSIAGLILFFMIALQCLSTFAVGARETGSWKFAWGQLVAFNLVAYVLTVALVQGLRALGVA